MRSQKTSDSVRPKSANFAHDAFDGEDIWGQLGYDDAQMQIDTKAGALDSQPEIIIAAARA